MKNQAFEDWCQRVLKPETYVVIQYESSMKKLCYEAYQNHLRRH
jgi:hypothetical protein